jgi:hypothetical protein
MKITTNNGPHATLPLFGATNLSLLAGGRNHPDHIAFGMYSLLYGTPQAPAACRYDDAGNVLGYSALRPLGAENFLPIRPGQVAPRIGQPYENGAMADPAEPDEISVGPWDLVATELIAKYDKVREGVLTHPLEGYFVAKFLSHDAVKYAQHDCSAYDVAAARTKIAQMELLRGALYVCHPEWEKNGQVSWPDFNRAAPKQTGFGLSN